MAHLETFTSTFLNTPTEILLTGLEKGVVSPHQLDKNRAVVRAVRKYGKLFIVIDNIFDYIFKSLTV